MRIQHTSQAGHLAILQGAARVGYINGSLIGFHGFSTPADASWAAWEAYRELEFRYQGLKRAAKDEEGFLSLELGDNQYVTAQGIGRIARLVPPANPGIRGEAWGFEMDIAQRDGVDRTLHEVFLTANARVMWRGIRNSGRGDFMLPWVGEPAERALANT